MKIPTFFGYMLRYSLPILIPVLCLCALIFLAAPDAGTPPADPTAVEAPAGAAAE